MIDESTVEPVQFAPGPPQNRAELPFNYRPYPVGSGFRCTTCRVSRAGAQRIPSGGVVHAEQPSVSDRFADIAAVTRALASTRSLDFAELNTGGLPYDSAELFGPTGLIAMTRKYQLAAWNATGSRSAYSARRLPHRAGKARDHAADDSSAGDGGPHVIKERNRNRSDT